MRPGSVARSYSLEIPPPWLRSKTAANVVPSLTSKVLVPATVRSDPGAPGAGDGLGEGDGLGDGDGLGEGEGDGLGEGDGDGLGEGDGLGDGVGDGLGIGVPAGAIRSAPFCSCPGCGVPAATSRNKTILNTAEAASASAR